jgi:hypothetical protein
VGIPLSFLLHYHLAGLAAQLLTAYTDIDMDLSVMRYTMKQTNRFTGC